MLYFYQNPFNSVTLLLCYFINYMNYFLQITIKSFDSADNGVSS